MVKIIGDGSTPRELATFQSFPEDFIERILEGKT